MKTINTILTILLFSVFSFAQDKGINYKALIKDASGNLLSGQTIDIRFSIINSIPSSEYTETHTTTTDANGLIIVVIGEGTVLSGSFLDINWINDEYQLQTEIDSEQDGTFINLGTTQFNAVPYAYSSADNLWETVGNDAIAKQEKVGIGTNTPDELLHISDPNIASLKLGTPNFETISNIKLENGDVSGLHTFFKIENSNDDLIIAVDSDLNSGETGYVEKVNISNNGTINITGSISAIGSINSVSSINAGTTISAQNGTSINEFSSDGTLAGNSNNAVPTEAAVKSYVDNAISNGTKEMAIPATAFISSSSSFAISVSLARNTSGNGAVYAPIQFPVGTIITNVESFFRDNDSSNDIELSIVRLFSSGGGSTNLLTQTTLGNSSSGQTISNATSITIVDSYQFAIRVRPISGDSWTISDLGIAQVRLTYTE